MRGGALRASNSPKLQYKVRVRLLVQGASLELPRSRILVPGDVPEATGEPLEESLFMVLVFVLCVFCCRVLQVFIFESSFSGMSCVKTYVTQIWCAPARS